MDKAKFLKEKRESTKKRKLRCRKDLLITAYVNKRHPLIYKEAEIFYNKLNEIHPTKIDLRKTLEFKALPQADTIKDKMCLYIPLMPTQTVECPPTTQTVECPPTTQTVECPPMTQTVECPPTTPTQTVECPLLEDELPAGMLENIIKELKEDPQMSKIMKELEDMVNEDTAEDEDIDIDVEVDNRLEYELMQW